MNSKTTLPSRTVYQELKNVLPHGTELEKVHRHLNSEDAPWRIVPQLPTDVFAAIGHICQVSGAIGYFNPDPLAETSSSIFALSQDEKKRLKHIAKKWRKDGDSTGVQELWTQFLKSSQVTLRISDLAKDGIPLEWCKIAFQLLIVADRAAKGIGRHTEDGSKNRFTDQVLSMYTGAIEKEEPIPGTRLFQQSRFPATLAVFADRDVVCVQPKTRISQVGCTLRNLSANLALLPPRNSVRCQWSQAAKKPKVDDSAALDILLIPIPYTLDGCNFVEAESTMEPAQAQDEKPNWDNFHIKQTWLENNGASAIETLVLELVTKAKQQTKEVDGIIFPEYALNWTTFDTICKKAFKAHPELEFIIAGSSTNCEPPEEEDQKEKANYVLTAVNYDAGESETTRRIHVASRRKHHRWCLGRSQVREYALASSLNPSVKAWWEDHSIKTPELYFHQFRESSTFVTMICEDLARNDPCHEILRSVGPNLLFALLMDGPQLEQRWSARYASSLADDPGSAVLTFTSYGLIDRMNKTERYAESRSIALWKDDSGNIEKILMPSSKKDCGVLVSLNSVKVIDQTIDGRKVENRSWRFSSQQPIER